MVVDKLIEGVMADLRVPGCYADSVRDVVARMAGDYRPLFEGKSVKYRYYYQNPHETVAIIQNFIRGALAPLVARLPNDPDGVFTAPAADAAYYEFLSTYASTSYPESITHADWTTGTYGIYLMLQRIRVPVPITQDYRHTHVLGSTGGGKSTLLKNLIANSLQTNASVIVIDPHKQLVPALEHLDVRRDVVVIDPRNPPGINIFDIEDTEDEHERERVFANVVKMLTYLFREEGAHLTGKQDMVFEHLCHLVLVIKKTRGRNGTVMDVFDFLGQPEKFQKEIAALPPFIASFFPEFAARGSEYRNTAAELRYRLRTILTKPAIRKMLTSPTTELNLKQEMDKGSLILIDADQSHLAGMTPIFGKIFLAFIMQAARERGEHASPTHLYVDEAHRFLDEHANDLLIEARKFKVSCTFAHQHMEQKGLTPEIKGALQGAGTKFAGNVRANDARQIAADMHTTVDFLLNLRPFHFAAYVQGKMSNAVAILPQKDPLAVFNPLHRERAARAPYVPSLSPAPPPEMSDEY